MHPVSHQRKHQLLCDVEIRQHERTLFMNDRIFRSASKRRNPESLRLRYERRPKQRAQQFVRRPNTKEASSQPLQDVVHGLDPSGVIKNPVHSSPLSPKTKMTSREVEEIIHQRRHDGGPSAPLKSINKQPCKAC